MNPADIDILMWYYTGRGGVDHPNVISSIERYDSIVINLINMELIEKNLTNQDGKPMYQLTNRGTVYCFFLTKIPLPELRWEINIDSIKNAFGIKGD